MQSISTNSSNVNPLAKHFRQPAIYFSLPSKGAYWEQGSLEIGLNDQIAVYPMTTRDEIIIRTPDALLNGESVVQIIQSCCPQIKNAWKMPSIDVDATLIAIRIASYGQEMDVDTVCPNENCKNENKHGLDLTALLDGISSPNYHKTVDINGLKIKLKPQSYFEANKINLTNFEEQQVLRVINDENLNDEERVRRFQEHMNRLININIEIITAGTEYVETSDGIQVNNNEFISEFYNNSDNKVIRAVRDRFDEYVKQTELPKPRIKCEECGTEYPVEIQFDYANFFDVAS